MLEGVVVIVLVVALVEAVDEDVAGDVIAGHAALDGLLREQARGESGGRPTSRWGDESASQVAARRSVVGVLRDRLVHERVGLGD